MQCCIVTSDVLSESKHCGELNTDHISIGNWSNKSQGVSQFIEVAEGISEGFEEELAESETL